MPSSGRGKQRRAAKGNRWTHLTIALLREKTDCSQTGDHMASKRFHSVLMTSAMMGWAAVLAAKGAVAAEVPAYARS